MNQNQVKEILYDLVSEYFGGATVVWGMAKAVSPNVPQVALTMLSLVRPYQPIRSDRNGVPIYSYPSKTTVQVDLSTRGAQLSNDEGITMAHVNTAVNDLAEFASFINSVYVDNWCEKHDVSILVNQVNDLTGLINDTTWDYRAMCELEIGFTETVVGHTGINFESGLAYDEEGNPVPLPQPEFEPTPSGGGTQTLADDYTGYFEQVETEYEQEE